MSHFDEKTLQIVLSEEDKENFKEISLRFTPKGIKTPVSSSIMKKILSEIKK